jgi:hypothetical protein
MEKIVHALPGSNIIMSEEFKNALGVTPKNLIELCPAQFAGHTERIKLHLIPSDFVEPTNLENLKEELMEKSPTAKTAA